MFTILMDQSKFIRITTPNINLFQFENYIDSFQILVPQFYGDIDLRPFAATLQYVDENGNAFLDILEPDEELYKENYIRYTLPITTQITKSAGEIKLQMSFEYVDKEKLIQYSLHTSELTITIHQVKDYYRFSDSSLAKISKLIGELAEKADYIADATESVAKNTPDDLGIDEEGTLKLSVKGELIGKGVDVATVEKPDDDDIIDGIIDISGKYTNVTL